jgi:hypothetical protein
VDRSSCANIHFLRVSGPYSPGNHEAYATLCACYASALGHLHFMPQGPGGITDHNHWPCPLTGSPLSPGQQTHSFHVIMDPATSGLVSRGAVASRDETPQVWQLRRDRSGPPCPGVLPPTPLPLEKQDAMLAHTGTPNSKGWEGQGEAGTPEYASSLLVPPPFPGPTCAEQRDPQGVASLQQAQAVHRDQHSRSGEAAGRGTVATLLLEPPQGRNHPTTCA